MPVYEDLKPQAPWRSIAATGEDWQRIDRNLLGGMLVEIEWIRAFEEMVLELAREGLVHGPAHSSIGQEGGAVGSVLALSAGDQINGSHRGHHQFLAKALQHIAPDGLNPRAPLNDAIDSALEKTLAEIMGLAHGYCGGRGGSMHLRWKEAGALGTNAIVGGGVPFAAGTAWSLRHAGTDSVAVTYFGDGAVNIGSVFETMNLAAAWRLPLCFFIENNLYAVATTVEESTAEPRLSARGQGFHIPAWRVDGMDPLAVYLAMGEALAHMRGGWRTGDRRGGSLPVLSPERSVSRKRFRISQQDRRSGMARTRSVGFGGEAGDRSRALILFGNRCVATTVPSTGCATSHHD